MVLYRETKDQGPVPTPTPRTWGDRTDGNSSVLRYFKQSDSSFLWDLPWAQGTQFPRRWSDTGELDC